jgi:hypothetical protein
MAFVIPKFVYNPGTGNVTLSPTYANVKKPFMDDFEAVRHDSTSSSGVRQSMTERVDRIRPITFESVPWADLPDWENFLAYAIQGGPFEYFPDATLGAFQTFQLVDDKVSPKYQSFGLSSISFSMRLVPS